MHMRFILFAGLAMTLTVGAQVFSDLPPVDLPDQAASAATNRPTIKTATAVPTTSARGTNILTSNSHNAATETNDPARYLADEKYHLRIGDKLSFQILEDREPQPRSLTVMDSGELDVPYLGRVTATDKTCRQLSDEIKALLEKEYYHRATVVLAVDAANRILGRVYVWGQVRNQGAIEIQTNEKLTAGKAILRAGGFADFANKKKVKLVRAAAEGRGEKPAFQLNMVEILDEGRTEKDVVLQPEDFIVVPARLVNF